MRAYGHMCIRIRIRIRIRTRTVRRRGAENDGDAPLAHQNPARPRKNPKIQSTNATVNATLAERM